jgi:hypothetical protein
LLSHRGAQRRARLGRQDYRIAVDPGTSPVPSNTTESERAAGAPTTGGAERCKSHGSESELRAWEDCSISSEAVVRMDLPRLSLLPRCGSAVRYGPAQSPLCHDSCNSRLRAAESASALLPTETGGLMCRDTRSSAPAGASGSLHRRRLASGVGERLVDDRPSAINLSQREEVRHGHRAPEALLLQYDERRIADLLD